MPALAPLNPTRLQRADHYFSPYAVVLPDGVSLDDALKPEFWSHVVSRLRPGDTIRIMPEDGSYYAEALVRSRGTGYAKVKLLHHIPLDDEEDQADANDVVKVKWRGPHSKWSVIRLSDGHVLKEGLSDKADAQREALNYTCIAA